MLVEVCVYCGCEIGYTGNCTGCGTSTGETEMVEIPAVK